MTYTSPMFSWSLPCLLAFFLAIAGGFLFPPSLWAQSSFDNPKPGSFQSGKGVIDGWVCDTQRIDIVFNPGTAHESTFQAAYGTERGDTQSVCNDSDNGFGLLFKGEAEFFLTTAISPNSQP